MKEIRWVVAGDESRTVRDVVARVGGDDDAIRDGRVFIGKLRVIDASRLLDSGDELIIAPRDARTDSPTSSSSIELVVLAQTRDLIAVAKPAGIPTIPDQGGAAHSLLARVAKHLDKPLAAIHPTSRLDRDVSGVVIFAITAHGRAMVAAAREANHYVRRYVALAIPGTSLLPMGRWSAPIGRAINPRHRVINGRDATAAVTDYRVVDVSRSVALLAVSPITGRTHQIRLHARHAGAPLIGDRTYGGVTRLADASGRVLAFSRIALHAAQVDIEHEALKFSAKAPIPDELRSAWAFVGGKDTAWNDALNCTVHTVP